MSVSFISFSRPSNLIWVSTETSSLASPDLPGKQHSVSRNFATSVWENGSSCWTNTIYASISFMVLSLLRISLTGICVQMFSQLRALDILKTRSSDEGYFNIICLRVMSNFFFTSYVCLLFIRIVVWYIRFSIIPDLRYRSLSSWIWRGRVYQVKMRLLIRSSDR